MVSHVLLGAALMMHQAAIETSSTPPPLLNATRPSCSCLSLHAIRRLCGSVIKSIPLRLSWHCLHTSLFSPGGGRSLRTVCARARRRERKVQRKHCETLRAHQYSSQLSHTKIKCGFTKCQRIVRRRSAVPEWDFLQFWSDGRGVKEQISGWTNNHWRLELVESSC